MEKLMLMKHHGKKSYANDRRRLNRLLKKAGIPFNYETLWDGYKWTFPQSAYPNGDAVIHSYSYCSRHGYFETMGIGPEVGCVPRTAKELIELLRPTE